MPRLYRNIADHPTIMSTFKRQCRPPHVSVDLHTLVSTSKRRCRPSENDAVVQSILPLSRAYCRPPEHTTVLQSILSTSRAYYHPPEFLCLQSYTLYIITFLSGPNASMSVPMSPMHTLVMATPRSILQILWSP